jgi:hypothetical protein
MTNEKHTPPKKEGDRSRRGQRAARHWPDRPSLILNQEFLQTTVTIIASRLLAKPFSVRSRS